MPGASRVSEPVISYCLVIQVRASSDDFSASLSRSVYDVASGKASESEILWRQRLPRSGATPEAALLTALEIYGAKTFAV